MIDARLLSEVYRRPVAQLQADAVPMRDALELAEIDTDLRLAHWLSQVGHESGGLLWRREIWGPTKQQKRYERRFDQPWPANRVQARQSAYAANRLAYGLGNTEPSDGKRFMGRGWIQTTGRANHGMTTRRLRAELGNDVPDFVAQPERLEERIWSAFSAAVFWKVNGLNEWADANDLETLTRRINGGYNGLDHRKLLFVQAQTVLLLRSS